MKEVKIIAAVIAAVMGVGTVSASPLPVQVQAFTATENLTDNPATVSAENTAKYVLGDVNNDKMIDATDASSVLVEYSFLSTGTASTFSDTQKAAADVNSDGKIDSSDASLILVYYSYISTGGTIKDMKEYLESLADPPQIVTTAPATTSTTKSSSATTTKKTSASSTKTTASISSKPTTSVSPKPTTSVSSKTTSSVSPKTTTTVSSKTTASISSKPTTSVSAKTTASISSKTTTSVLSKTTTSISSITTSATVSSSTAPTTTLDSGRVSDIRITRTKMSLNIGEGELSAYVTMFPSSAVNKGEIWSSSDTNIATVDDQGWVIGVGEGTCTVTVKSADNPDVYAEIEVTVIDDKSVKDIRLTRTEMTLQAGYGELAAYVTMLPATAVDKSEEWTSSKPDVATVDDQGWVIGKKAGTSVITVRSVNNPAVFGIILVTVVDENTSETTTTAQTTTTNTTTPTTTTTSSGIPVEFIQVSENNVTLTEGEQKQISYRIVPSAASNKSLTWKSNDESVAMVDSSGTIVGVSTGTAVITISSAVNSNVRTNVLVTVNPKTTEVTEIKLSKYEMELNVGGRDISLITVYPPDAANKEEKWTSSDPSVATVDRFGWVTGISVGECNIIVESEDNPNVKAIIKVTVTNGEIDIPPTEINFSALQPGKSTNTHLAFATPVPANAKGNFAVEYIITDSNGNTSTASSPSITAPDTRNLVCMLTANTNQFTAESYLVNLDNGSRCKIGTYNFSISPRDAETVNENIIAAFKYVGGITE